MANFFDQFDGTTAQPSPPPVPALMPALMPRTAAGYRPTDLPLTTPDEIIANAQRGGGYVPTPDEAKAMSADIAARQPASAPANVSTQTGHTGGGNFFDQFDAPSARGSGPGDTWGDMGANVGAGGMGVVTGLAGAPVDALTFLRRQAATGFGTLTPEEALKRGADPALFNGALQVGGSSWLNKQLGRLDNSYIGGFNPEEIPANGPWERGARAAGAGVASMVLPAGAAGLATRAPAMALPADLAGATAVGTRAPATVGQATLEALKSGGTPGGAAIGGVGAVTGQVASDAVPEPYKPLANVAGNLIGGGAAALTPWAARSALGPTAGAVRDYVAPLGTQGQQRLAGQKLLNASGMDRGSLLSGLDQPNGGELVPGSAPTTNQLLGNPGLGELDRVARTQNSGAFNAAEAGQNAARVRAIQNAAPVSGNPANTQDFVARQLATLNAQSDAAVNTATANANALRDQLGGRLNDDQYGATMRSSLAEEKAAAKKAESALWNQIDPKGSLVIDPTATTEAANKITAAMPKLAKPMSGDEAALFADATNLPSALPFSEFTAFRSRLLDEIRNERFNNGETPALRRMQQLRQAVDNTIAGAGQAADANAAPAGSLLRGTPEPPAPSMLQGTPKAPEPSLLQGSPQQSRPASPGVGNQVFTPSGRGLPVRYEVVEGSSLVPSHTQDLTPNPDFPAELQPRERSRIASEAQIGGMAARLQPERLGASADATTGAPIVSPEGIVESGNARTLAILRAHQQGGASSQAYRDYLTGQGFNISDMENPVLIRRRTSDLSPADRVKFTQEANASPGLAMSATERAAQDAERLPASALDLYKDGDIASAENRPFVKSFMGSVPEKNEMGALATKDGALSLEGAARVRNALLAKAYGDLNLIGSLAETGDPDIKAFGGALSNAAGSVARLNAGIEAGLVPKSVDIAPALVEAARVVQRARASRTPIADLVAQQDAFSKLSPEALDVLHAAYGSDLRQRLSQARLGNILDFYTREATGQSTEAALFANEVNARDILAAGIKRYGRSTEVPGSPGLPLGSEAPVSTGVGIRGADVRGPGGAPGGAAANEDLGRRGNASRSNASIGVAEAASAPLTANFTSDNAAAYRRAADASRTRIQTYNAGPVGQVRRGGKAGLAYNVAESSVPGKFFNAGSHAKEDIAAYVKAVGDRPTAIDALKDYAASDLRSYAEKDGILKPQRVETWLRDHADALRAFPELAKKFKDAGSAQEAVGEATAARKAALDDFQKSAAHDWLGDDPLDLVDRAFRSPRSLEKISDMATRVSVDPDAKAGFERAAADWIERRFVSNTEAADTGVGKIKSDSFQNFIKLNRPALLRVFGEDRLQGLEAVVEDLRRANRSIGATRQPMGSNTPQDLAAIAKHGSAKGDHLTLGQVVGAEMAGRLTEHAAGALSGHGLIGTLAHGAGMARALVGNYMRRAGLRGVDNLVNEAMLNPRVAKALVMKLRTPAAKERAAVILNRALNRQAVPILLHGNDIENGEQR